MNKTRVLIVDDSNTVRRRFSDALATRAEFEVVGEAADGRSAVDLCGSLRPDVVALDLVLPGMNGLAATEAIMAFHPTPILIVSASTNRGELFQTYDALAAGAVDVLEKPNGEESDADWDARFLEALRRVARVKVITHLRAKLRAMRGGELPPNVVDSRVPAAPEAPSRDPRRIQVVAIGASTGGPGALRSILRALPSDFPTPIVVVMHLAKTFATAFAAWLDGQSALPVSFAEDGAELARGAGRVFLAPPDEHLAAVDGRLRLLSGLPMHSCRPSVDVLFDSIAIGYGPRAAGCLLTGMGRDGAEGLLKMRRAGALTIAEAESSAVVYGMPREAVERGAAERVTPLEEIPEALIAAVRSGRPRGGPPEKNR